MNRRNEIGQGNENWLLTLSNRWQFAAGLGQRAGLPQIERALEMVLEMLGDRHEGLERMLVRGFLLEIAAGIRAACRTEPARTQAQLVEISERLSAAGTGDADLRHCVNCVLARLRQRPALGDPRLAHRALAWLDTHCGSRVTVARLARELGTNTRYLSGTFKREFGISVAAHQRRQRADAALAMLAAGAAVKQVAREFQCTEATLRRLVRAATGRTPRQLRGRAA